jgi:hypothetical protein
VENYLENSVVFVLPAIPLSKLRIYEKKSTAKSMAFLKKGDELILGNGKIGLLWVLLLLKGTN